jgi:protocatechuate 3,4-dioxygenase beta subunit
VSPPDGRADPEDHDRGLGADLPLLRRRALLGLFAGAGLAVAAGCADTDSPLTTTITTPDSGTDAPPTTTPATGSCVEIPEETAGPFPADGSNGANVLNQTGVVRSDIRSSFGTASGVAAGVPLTIMLTVSDSGASCAPFPEAAVYVWHCDRDGRYSLYSPGVTGENYLRGVQVVDSAGAAHFTSIFPACYPGRWPHIHFEIYQDLGAATSGAGPLATSQIALAKDVCDAVYTTEGYGESARNLAGVALDTDPVFRDGWTRELATVTGRVGSGLAVALVVPVGA